MEQLQSIEKVIEKINSLKTKRFLEIKQTEDGENGTTYKIIRGGVVTVFETKVLQELEDKSNKLLKRREKIYARQQPKT
jgi:hypothetical protein